MSNKASSQMVSLVEELGDARLRCDQLVRYIAEAVKLINQSSHKEHFFEVAGHLLQGIPETAFKLHKALQAVALMAAKLDYEELKLELRPEKVDELEKVLQEVRFHQIKRRSETPMTPNQVATQLRNLAKTARDEGRVPVREIAALVGRLDNNRVAGASVSVADALEKVANALETVETKPSRIQLANLLSRMAMEANFDSLVKSANKPLLSQLDQFSNAEEVKKKFKAENPKLSDEDLEEIAKQWETNKDVVKDKSASADRLERLVSGIEEQVKEMRHALDTYNKDPGKYAPQLKNLRDAGWAITTSLRVLDRTLPDMMKTASEQDLLARADSLIQRVAASILWKYTDEDGKDFYLSTRRRGTIRSPYTGKAFTADAKRATMGEVGKELKEDEVKIKGSLWKYVDGEENEFYLPERLTTTLRSPTTGKTFKPKAERFTLGEVGKNLREEGKKASSEEEAKRSRFEEGKPADPTENMDPEDAEEWKANTEEYGDKFKSASEDILAWKA